MFGGNYEEQWLKFDKLSKLEQKLSDETNQAKNKQFYLTQSLEVIKNIIDINFNLFIEVNTIFRRGT